MRLRYLFMKDHRIWKDKNIKPEYKEIFSYLYQKGFDRIVFHINIWEIQSTTHITNVGLRKCMKTLEDNNYIKYIEYDRNLYEITIC